MVDEDESAFEVSESGAMFEIGGVELWHERMGHVGIGGLRRTIEAEAIAGSGRTERNRIGRDGTGRDSINLVVAGRFLKGWEGMGWDGTGQVRICHDTTVLGKIGQDK